LKPATPASDTLQVWDVEMLTLKPLV